MLVDVKFTSDEELLGITWTLTVYKSRMLTVITCIWDGLFSSHANLGMNE